MPRPPKRRRVSFVPTFTYFKPAAVPLSQLEEVVLAVEELEAIRLRDLEGLEQEECAERMGVSRPTFFRILSAARSKVADALIHGKAIRVEGGIYHFEGVPLFCPACGYRWLGQEEGGCCPRCGSPDTSPFPGKGHCWRHGWRGGGG
ncbi:MAG TPA: DUF134 domain-containing protein [Moorella mulderi]|nr:DUF134 domain-containing protein [Moorella mulderi]